MRQTLAHGRTHESPCGHEGRCTGISGLGGLRDGPAASARGSGVAGWRCLRPQWGSRQFRGGLCRSRRRPRSHSRRSGARRLDQQAGRQHRRDEACRAGQARPRQRCVGLPRLDASKSGIPFAANPAPAIAVAHKLRPRPSRPICDSARRQRPVDHGGADELGSETRTGRRLFQIFEPQFPDRRVDRGASDGRAVRPLDAARSDRADEARRLLQLADLQRCEGRPRGGPHAGRQGR